MARMNAIARTGGQGEARRPAVAHRPTVALCGGSVLMSSVGASLRGGARLRTLPSEPGPACGARRLRKIDAVVFELLAPPPAWTMALLKARRRVVVVGISAGSDEVIVLSGRSCRVFTGGDLLKVIEAHLGPRRDDRKG